MTIERRDSQQTTCAAFVERDGAQVQAAQVSCTLRPGRNLYISCDLVDGVTLTEEERAETAALFAGYLAEEIAKAAETGIPLTLPAD